MIAIISDIHSNTEALSAVLEDIRRHQVEQIICLGDLVGYGPNPGPCLDMIIQHCQMVILGNHDYAVLYEPTHFNLGAESAVYWTRSTLREDPDEEKVKRRYDFLGKRPIRKILSGKDFGVREILLLHGSPRRPINEYIFPDDIYTAPEKVSGAFEKIAHVCFVGHTHVPGVFRESLDFRAPDDIGGEYEFNDEKVLINVGSVGQPRDRDPRASYVILSPGKVRFRRVEYDCSKTMQKILDTQELDDYSGRRLLEGR